MFHLPVLRKLIQLLRMSRKQSAHHPPRKDRILYEEKVFNRNNTILFLALALCFLFLAYRMGNDHYLPIKDRDMFFPFFLMLVIAINFSVLRVRITFWGLFLRFGILHYETPWTEVKDLYTVTPERRRLFKGWGVTVTSSGENGMRLSYRVPGKPEAICVLKSGVFSEVAFSTLKPEMALTALNEGVRCSSRSGKQ